MRISPFKIPRDQSDLMDLGPVAMGHFQCVSPLRMCGQQKWPEDWDRNDRCGWQQIAGEAPQEVIQNAWNGRWGLPDSKGPSSVKSHVIHCRSSLQSWDKRATIIGRERGSAEQGKKAIDTWDAGSNLHLTGSVSYYRTTKSPLKDGSTQGKWGIIRAAGTGQKRVWKSEERDRLAGV